MTKEDIDLMSEGQKQILLEGMKIGARQREDSALKALYWARDEAEKEGFSKSYIDGIETAIKFIERGRAD